MLGTYLVYTVFAILASISEAHVRLTFPPARRYALDFLDNGRTRGPCGFQPYAGAPRTTLIEGTKLRVTWHLAYSHRGGAQIQIIKENPFVVVTSLTGGAFLFQNDSTRQYADVVLPVNYTCDSCAIRLFRQASEWGGAYRFWSCSDVTILRHPNASSKCLNNGTCDPVTGLCSCVKLFSGDRCENKDQCWVDSDCGRGRCIDTRSTTYPKLMCYCEAGWHGESCDTSSDIVVQQNYSSNPDYWTRELSPGNIYVHWRLVRNNTEIEIAVRAKTLSWVGIGWRPRGLTTRCKSFPYSGSRPTLDRAYMDIVTALKSQPIVAMDCIDVVIGSVKGNLHRVQDMYTRDRSTPRADAFYGGSDDITGSAGSQVDGFTTIVFRKKTRAILQCDHSIVDAPMQVVWAIGQGLDSYGHRPGSGLEACTAKRFYRHDEIKYHGTNRLQRGSSTMNFYENPTPPTNSPAPGVCSTLSGEYKLPRSCDSSAANFNCEYFLSWTLDSSTNAIQFTLKQSRQANTRWIALGISSDKRMANTDVISAYINSQGTAVVQDRYV
uniref:EGF-like domain-containing protein n=1 Tax=Ciona intestinalis TaxID=7719 RepID=H2XT76_CIOIN